MAGRKLLLSFFLVVTQFACLVGIALTGPLIPGNYALLAVQLAGLGLGLWAVFSMRIGNFNIFPQPLTWSKLVVSGPYKVRLPV